MYESAMEAMTTRQIKAITYHDWKACNVLKEILKYMFNYPETNEKKLQLKWTESGQTVNEKHAPFLIEYQKQGEMVTKWKTKRKT